MKLSTQYLPRLNADLDEYLNIMGVVCFGSFEHQPLRIKLVAPMHGFGTMLCPSGSAQ
jgi:hypothetical protein